MTLAPRDILPCRATIFLSLAIAVLGTPADCRTKQQSAGVPATPPQAKGARAKSPARPTDLEAFATEVESAPPELASDALIKLASSARVADPAWKKELLERAFVLAGTSRWPVREKPAPYVSALADNSAQYLSLAYGLRLDALSLRVRAVRAMLALDARRAREMFGQIPAEPSLPARSCKDAMVYDVSDFYALAGDIALQSFDREEVEQGVRARFILAYVEAVSSPAQVVSAIRLVLAAVQHPEDMMLLAPALAKAIRSIPADDRSFTSAISSDGLADAAGDLARELEKRKDGLAGEFVEACRRFIRAGMTGERCAEDVPRRPPPYLSDANSILFKSSPLKPEELSPAEVGVRADIRGYWQTPEAKALLNSYKRLRFGDDPAAVKFDSERIALTREDTGTPEWDAQLQRFLSDLEGWDGAGENSELDYFNQQQMLFVWLLEITPARQARSEVLASWLKSLGGERDGAAGLLRYYYAGELLRAVKASPPEVGDEFLKRMIYSNDTALSTFAKEAKLKI